MTNGARAQAVPAQVNPGGIQNELQRQEQQFERRSEPQKQQGPSVVGPKPEQSALLKPGGPKFALKALKINDSYFLSKEELNAITSPYVGKRVEFSDLQKILAAINDLYREKGVVTGIATLPPQQVKDGVVTIQLTEGRLGRLTITGNTQTTRAYILDRIHFPAPGEVVDIPKITKEVTWFNRTNDVQLRVLLQPGSAPGLTNIELIISEPAIHTWQVFVDNEGVYYTGTKEIGTYYRGYGFLGMDDRFTFYSTGAQGNLNGNISYNLAVNPSGGRLGFSYTQGAIKIVNGPFQALDITGQSKLGTINYSQPAWADEHWLLLGNVAGTRSQTTSEVLSAGTVDDLTWKETGGFSLTNYGKDYSLSIAPGANNVQSFSEITQLERRFQTYTASMQGQIKLPVGFSFITLGAGQYTGAQLLPGDQLFQIGGPTTVRGYISNLVAGDKGYYLNFELHRDMSDLIKGIDVFVFHDHGEVFSTSPQEVELASAGAGASWTGGPFTFAVSGGAPITAPIAGQPRAIGYARIILRPLDFFP